ncbi:MAG: hypothetical protein ACYS8Z_15595, partial [Planctomycetota bacterium]
MWKKGIYLMCLISVLYPGGRASASVKGWWNEDVGDPLPGNATESDGTLTVTANGSDIFHGSDNFHYVYKLLSGDGEISARVVSIGGPSSNSWRKAGVMIREDLSGPSFHAFMALTPTPNYSVAFQYRDVVGDSDSEHGIDRVSPPYWVKLVRQGNQFTGYHSSDGVNWIKKSTAGEGPDGVNPVTINMDTEVCIGLAVTSHEAGELCTCEFDNVNLAGNITSRPLQLKAHNPIPADGAGNVLFSDYGGVLSWTTGETAVWQYAYFGTTESGVANAGTTAPEYIGRINAAETTMMPLRSGQPATAYYWRLDQEEGDGNIVKGDVWSFKTAPLKAINPEPPDGAENVDPNTDLLWKGGWDSYNGFDVYFGTNETDVTNATTESPECISTGQMLPSYDPG